MEPADWSPIEMWPYNNAKVGSGDNALAAAAELADCWFYANWNANLPATLTSYPSP
ncbi:MAG: hypothetical protein KJ726_08785 [Verrucomicrobia bacterium]|nr:hypothetical protein [Verrucomicrobiota bacterium]MBU1910130.1 hypothetical protein [Verrucomicrobiota bacterium]